jgi:photosystem II stability/assembly factor-like uncharacterized protein
LKPFRLLLFAVFSIVCAFAADPTPAARGLLLDATTVGPAIIAVGERGSILRSADSGQTWTALTSPTRATLTGISFADSNRGWIVGHDGIILATRDGGASWIQQHNDKALSFLDVLALDPHRACVIGSFGSCFTTNDGGTTWTQRKALEEDLHLNRITTSGNDTLFIAGERGTLLRTTRNLETFTAAPTGYEGSFFGVLPFGPNALLAYGLRGHVYRSEGTEIAWQPIALETPSLIMTAVKLKTGTIILAGQARAFFVSKDDGRTFHAWQPGLTTAVAELLEAPDGTLLAFGEAGITRLPKPE